ncbi:hypothetical protein [Winogradskyella schleiferi]|uniref:hypothetical protein n=1 Tax=Winogradskyella schleiferi TaxID=2686078 RepID=UPI0015BAACFD|nr:hypothetical protein [Winogradskyella schleiferi]
MKKIFIILFLTNISLSFGQISTKQYQTGIFETYDNFLKNEIKLQDTITAKQNRNKLSTSFRLKNSNGKKIKDSFAIFDGNHLYFRANSIQQHFTNKINDSYKIDKAGYFRVLLSNDNYFYFESFFQCRSDASNHRIGSNYRAGIIYDISKGKFTVFYTIEDLKKFLEEALNIKVSYDDSDRLSLQMVRYAMEDLFK